MVHRICIRVFVHVGHAKVIGHWSRTPLSYDVWIRHKAWAENLVYKGLQAMPRSQCVVVMAVSVCKLGSFLMYRRSSLL